MDEDVSLNARIDSLFDAADHYASKIYLNEKIRYFAWLADPYTSAEKKNKIFANLAWADAVWAVYLSRKEDVVAGGNVNGDFTELGEPPHSFMDIAITP
jgi:hypothetical protein